MNGAAAEPGRIASAFLALAVHALFFALLTMGVNWQKKYRDAEIMTADLWGSLPSLPQPRSEMPPHEEPPPEPVKPAVPPPKAKPAAAPQAKPDIALKARKERKRQEEHRQAEETAKIEQQRRMQQEAEEAARVQREQNEALRRAQEQRASAQARLVGDYKDRITARIKRYVNKQPCAALDRPEILADVALLPGGELVANPRIVKSSGSEACDRAIESAIVRAQPLPLPPDPALFREFRELHLKFRPTEE